MKKVSFLLANEAQVKKMAPNSVSLKILLFKTTSY